MKWKNKNKNITRFEQREERWSPDQQKDGLLINKEMVFLKKKKEKMESRSAIKMGISTR